MLNMSNVPLLEALRDTAETLSSSLSYEEVLDHILAAVGRVVPHDAATIMLINGEVCPGGPFTRLR